MDDWIELRKAVRNYPLSTHKIRHTFIFNTVSMRLQRFIVTTILIFSDRETRTQKDPINLSSDPQFCR